MHNSQILSEVREIRAKLEDLCQGAEAYPEAQDRMRSARDSLGVVLRTVPDEAKIVTDAINHLSRAAIEIGKLDRFSALVQLAATSTTSAFQQLTILANHLEGQTVGTPRHEG